MVERPYLQRPVQLEITEQTLDAVVAWIEAMTHLKPEQFLFSGRVSAASHLSTRKYSISLDSAEQTEARHRGTGARGYAASTLAR
jgi:hypothetical protein